MWVCCSPLVHLAMKTLERFDAAAFLACDEKVLWNWLQLVESNYHADNPYHNSTHAADVMHATAYFLNCEKLKVALISQSGLSSSLLHMSSSVPFCSVHVIFSNGSTGSLLNIVSTSK